MDILIYAGMALSAIVFAASCRGLFVVLRDYPAGGRSSPGAPAPRRRARHRSPGRLFTWQGVREGLVTALLLAVTTLLLRYLQR